jgi:hypothetical protein
MPTDIVGSPAEVQDARSTEKSAAAIARLSPFARHDPADFKTNSPSVSGRYTVARRLNVYVTMILVPDPETRPVSNPQA